MYPKSIIYSLRGVALALIFTCTNLFTACTPAENKQEITSETTVTSPESTPAPTDQIASADPAMETGKKLFSTNCAMCHALTKDDLIGPGLAGVNQRREQAWLISWIKNSQKMIESGDKVAVELFNKYNKVVMPAYDYSDEEIKSILAYIDAEQKL